MGQTAAFCRVSKRSVAQQLNPILINVPKKHICLQLLSLACFQTSINKYVCVYVCNFKKQDKMSLLGDSFIYLGNVV